MLAVLDTLLVKELQVYFQNDIKDAVFNEIYGERIAIALSHNFHEVRFRIFLSVQHNLIYLHRLSFSFQLVLLPEGEGQSIRVDIIREITQSICALLRRREFVELEMQDIHDLFRYDEIENRITRNERREERRTV